MADVWTLSEYSEHGMKDVSLELLGRGRALADSLGVSLAAVVLGHGIDETALQSLIEHGADVVYVADDPCLADFTCESYANVLVPLIKEHKPQVMIAAATTTGRTLMPYVAVQVHAGLTADCTELAIEPGTGNLLQTRPAIGGNIMATIKSPDHRPQMATIRPRSTKKPMRDGSRVGTIVHIPPSPSWKNACVEVLGLRSLEGQGASIEEAEIVVSGGKGLKKRDNFTLVENLAKALGGEVGASRDAVDRGWAAYPHQVGLSGKTISPRLYVAVGISGAIQHLAGIKTAKCIVAINHDEHASILDFADFALVGDLFTILPEIQKRLEARRQA